MKKLLLRSAMFSPLLTFLCGAISHRYIPRVEAMAAPAADMDPHMSMTKLVLYSLLTKLARTPWLPPRRRLRSTIATIA
jgi:hypothetical protein